MPTQKTQAIVIRSHPLGEVHKIIRFYTVEFGKVSAVAHGSRRPKSRFGGSIELLNYGNLVFFEYPNKDLHRLEDFDLVDDFDAVKADFDRTTYGCYLAELVDATELAGQVADQSVFHLLHYAFEMLARADDIPLLARAFELQFLALAGYAPQLSRCVACAEGFHSAAVNFSPHLGGLLCANCKGQDTTARTISRGSCELMKQLQRFDFSHLHRFRASRLNHRELKFVLSNFISYHTERTLKSREFIDNL